MAFLNTERRLLTWWRRRGGAYLAGVALALATALPVAAQSRPFHEYQVKAVFLFNFTQFVEWPPGAFSAAEAPFCIGVLGDDSFGGLLDEAVQGERVNGRPVVIRRYRRVEEIEHCQVIAISRSEAWRLESILAHLRAQPVLTVSDIDQFAQRGGMIQLVTERGKVRLRINLEAAKAAQLTLSSKLLRAADVMGQPRG